MKVSLRRFASVPFLALLVAGCSGPPMRPDPPPVLSGNNSDAGNEEIERTFGDRLHRDLELSLADNRQLYSPLGLGILAAGVAGAAPLANTSADQDIRDWYQHRIKQK